MGERDHSSENDQNVDFRIYSKFLFLTTGFLDWTFSGLLKVPILQSLDEGFLELPRFLDK